MSSHLPHTVTNNNLFSNKESSLTILDAPLIAIKLIWVGQDKTKAILNTYPKKKMTYNYKQKETLEVFATVLCD